MIDFGALLSSTSAAIGIAKAVREVQGEFDRADLKLKMAELTGTLADVKIALVDVRDELAAKDKEIERLKAAFAFKGETVESSGWRFQKARSGQAYGKPFCPKCIEDEARFVLTRQYGGYSEVFCPHCKTKYPMAQTFLELDEMAPAHRGE
ncbi:hypothetical protein [Reyranella sp.]|jgi:phage FluMu protein Com|uniref:hypothetical protein n=1 Tax=Reyranella sp. TaxID=1929291 RepID=UPI000BD7B029|nr:hypothetical protein [Reyranella sp.]OYY46668.1 MAG: hypothetical protein B7Y57_00010 [Rhodospirillales bacterium 35-66-84]OYZ96688.1 MAG: hypothetical protein B7Y08_00370 [Rhodospirillales bacterium 24-66-33]OZB27985.1 MAG: hypothetical protein B7X63_04770 [Rhodospirillales bacterium 39-66-50]HQS18456.1 hypothetical protein [Reyranella sp.]HQT10051.1 hypothetical protein [Reyranella sp.]